MSKEDHEKQLKNYICLKSNRIFSNSNKELFDLLIKIVFTTSKNKINWMLSNPEKTKIFLTEKNFDIIKQYVESGKNLSMILIGNYDSIIKDYKSLAEKNKNFTFKYIPEKLKVQNILTWDDIGYRFTPDQNKLTSVACRK